MTKPYSDREQTTISDEEVRILRTGLEMMALKRLGADPEVPDLVQEVISRVVSAAGNGQIINRETLGSFASGVARNVFADHLRTTMRERSREGVDAETTRDPSAGALEKLVTREEKQRVRQAVSRLGTQDRNILKMSYYDRLTPREIAKTTGEPASRIRKRKSRALDRLRRAFLDGHENGSGATS